MLQRGRVTLDRANPDFMSSRPDLDLCVSGLNWLGEKLGVEACLYSRKLRVTDFSGQNIKTVTPSQAETKMELKKYCY